jgi:hypothetical protein
MSVHKHLLAKPRPVGLYWRFIQLPSLAVCCLVLPSEIAGPEPVKLLLDVYKYKIVLFVDKVPAVSKRK